MKVFVNDTNNNLLNIVTKASLKNIMITSINEFSKDNNRGYSIIFKVKNKNDLDDFKESIRILPFVDKIELED